MLRFLRVRNLAVIEALEVEFEPGMTVLTGETGAGKSILVEAVGLLLGARASSDLVRTGEDQAVVEAIFESDAGDVVVRREVTSQGRNRAFVGGDLCTAAALREVTTRFAEIHGQHEHHTLLDPGTHMALLDEHAQLAGLAGEVGEAWARVHALRLQSERASMDAREKAARLDLIAFQLGDIEKVAPRAGEDEQLSATRQVLSSAERVERLCGEGYGALYEKDGAILGELAGVWKRVGELAELDPQFSAYLDARDSIKGQLEDLAFALRRYAEGVDASPARLQEVEDRLAALERLKRKYGPALDDVIAKGQALAEERDLLTGAGGRRDELDRALQEATRQYLGLAQTLSRQRRAGAVPFSQQLVGLLGELAMPRAQFDVRFAPVLGAEEWGSQGIDRGEFFLSPNPGEELRPLARIASGGELSRVMLALKTLGRGRDAGKTMIFDEVDAGIGGEVAAVVGQRLASLAGSFQVLCITHLPQIAAAADAQYLIEKRVRAGRTSTAITRLDAEARIGELGRMIGGAVITDAVRASARDLLARRPGRKAKGESESRRQRRPS